MGTGSHVESGFYPAVIETARIVNVNVADWSVDAVSMTGNRRFFDIQVMSPYFHFFNGEGIYAMPEVGAICYVAQGSEGMRANHFVLGFGTVIDERPDPNNNDEQLANFRSNRQTLNPGDIMLRTRDENFIVLRRGGVVQIGATPSTQRLYIPVQNIIRDVCENYQMFSLAGEMLWTVDRVDQDDAGNVKCRFQLKSKTTANDPEHAVILTAGSHADDDALRLSLIVNESGEAGAPTVVQLRMDKEGNVTWLIEKSLTVSVNGDVSITAEKKDILLKATAGKATLQAKQDALVQSESGKATLRGAAGALVDGGPSATVKGKAISLDGKVQIGGSGAAEPVVLGTQLLLFMTEMIQAMNDPSKPAGLTTMPGTPILMPGLLPLIGKLNALLSKNNLTS